MSKPLNPKQLKFVAGVIAGKSATQAYIDAGYKGRGNSAESAAAQLLRNVQVKEALDAHRAAANANNGITAEWYAARIKLEAMREGEGSSHAARVSALKLAGDLLGIGEKHKHEHTGADGKPVQHEHSVNVSVTARLAELTAAFTGAADREEAGTVPGDRP